MDEKRTPPTGGSPGVGGASGSGTGAQGSQAPGQTQWGAGSTGTVVDQGQGAPISVGSEPSDNLHGASQPVRPGGRGDPYAQARHSYREGKRALSHRVTEAPLLTLLAVGAVGYVLAWTIHGRQSATRTRMPSRARTRRDLPGQQSGKPLIESDRVEGTAVYDPSGNQIGTIKRVMIEKVGGRVTYAVLSFGGFMGVGQDEHAIPWQKLDYDTNLEGYRTDITEDQLRNAPNFSYHQDGDWADRSREQALHDHYRVTAYWIVP